MEALQPWHVFFRVERPHADIPWADRIPRNVKTFWANYLVVGVAFLGLMILDFAKHPERLFFSTCNVCGWLAFIKFGCMDAEWKPVIYGVSISVAHRLCLMAIVTTSVLYSVM